MDNNIVARFPETGSLEKDGWLTFIHKCNEVRSSTFGKPNIKDWWAGGVVEEYRNARVIFAGDDTVRIVSKTKIGSSVMREAAEQMKIALSPA